MLAATVSSPMPINGSKTRGRLTPAVSIERNRFDAHSGRKSASRLAPVDWHGAAHGGSEHGAQLFARTAFRTSAENIYRRSAVASQSPDPGTNFSQSNGLAHLVHSELSSPQQYVQQRPSAATGRE